MKTETTDRGFVRGIFEDSKGVSCVLQESSAAEATLWLGVEDGKRNAQIMDQGWKDYHIPDDVLLWDRMHLNRKQVKALVKELKYWLKEGRLKT